MLCLLGFYSHAKLLWHFFKILLSIFHIDCVSYAKSFIWYGYFWKQTQTQKMLKRLKKEKATKFPILPFYVFYLSRWDFSFSEPLLLLMIFFCSIPFHSYCRHCYALHASRVFVMRQSCIWINERWNGVFERNSLLLLSKRYVSFSVDLPLFAIIFTMNSVKCFLRFSCIFFSVSFARSISSAPPVYSLYVQRVLLQFHHSLFLPRPTNCSCLFHLRRHCSLASLLHHKCLFTFILNLVSFFFVLFCCFAFYSWFIRFLFSEVFLSLLLQLL